MSYSIRITGEAEKDLREIYEYIAFSLLSPQNAVAQLERLEKEISKLDEMPNRFRLYDKEPWYSRGLRIMPVDNFIVFYIPNEEIKVVTVIRVMYGGRNIENEMQKSSLN